LETSAIYIKELTSAREAQFTKRHLIVTHIIWRHWSSVYCLWRDETSLEKTKFSPGM